jgi:predicted enzyme involved in methoxymalonyl-ACP biosynthesis
VVVAPSRHGLIASLPVGASQAEVDAVLQPTIALYRKLWSTLATNDAMILVLRLSDRFGDHGLVSTLIAVHEGNAVRIDSRLMSCRVFARSAEQFILRGLVDQARARGATSLIGEYLPTVKNGVVAELYPRLGFTQAGAALFTRDLAASTDDLIIHVAGA